MKITLQFFFLTILISRLFYFQVLLLLSVVTELKSSNAVSNTSQVKAAEIEPDSRRSRKDSNEGETSIESPRLVISLYIV